MITDTSTTTMTSAQTLTANYALAENALNNVVGTSSKWLQLYEETETTLEISYTTGTAETNNYVEFYLEYGSGNPDSITWVRETVEYLDDSVDQIILQPWTYKIEAAAAATTYTARIQLPACTKGVRIYVKEVGVAVNYGSITIKANTQAQGSAYNRQLQTVTLEASGVTIGDVNINSSTVQAVGSDATGADIYATVLTPSAAAKHIDITNTGTHPAIISLDGGTTDHIFVAGNSTKALDWVSISSGVAIQAKNGTAGSNYTGLYISIW